MSYPEGSMAEPEEQSNKQLPLEQEELQKDTAAYLAEIQKVLADPTQAPGFATQLALEKRNLERRSQRDLLTGLLNRRGFDLEFDRFLRKFRRSLEGRKIGGDVSLGSILFIDLDHFTKANEDEARGRHAFGDRVLKEVAGIIADTLRPDDLVYRYGGEEIVVFLTGSNLHNAIGVSERVRKTVHTETATRLEGYSQTVSIGVAQIPENVNHGNITSLAFLGDDGLIEWVRKGADEAMYFAKESGRNRTAFKTIEGSIGVLEQNQSGNGVTARYKALPPK